MEKKGFSCEVKLDIHLVSCPGTRHLSNRNMLFLRIALLGCSKRTKSVYASFPMIFNERLYFERIFVNANEPDQVMEILEGGKLLAYYEQSSRKFLFPDRTFTKKDGMDREILLNRTANFMGINPKLEFSTTTTMQEARVTASYRNLFDTALSSSDDEVQRTDSTCSEKEEEDIPVMHSTSVRTPKLTSADKHCVCECPRRPENHGQVVVKSRSLSPRLKRSKFHIRKSTNKKPPFKTGKADESIISRRDFPPSPKIRKRNKMRSSLPNTPMPAEGDPSTSQYISTEDDIKFPTFSNMYNMSGRVVSDIQARTEVPCQSCRVPHKDCIVCQAYYKVYGKEFLQYRFGPDRRLRSSSTPLLTSLHTSSPTLARARLPDSGPTSDDIAYSRPLSKNRKIFRRSNGSEGYSSYRDSSSQSDEMHEKVKELLAKTKIYSNGESTSSDGSDSDKDSLFSLQELRSEIDEARQESLNRSFEDPDHPPLGTRLNRSVTVPLNDTEYWSNMKSSYTGHDHRSTFEESLQSIYHDLYSQASQAR